MIAFANREHSNHRIFENIMEPLAKELCEALNREREIVCVLSYEATEDFYHCRFEAGGKKFDIRFYRLFSLSIDGKDKWVGCPPERQYALIHHVAKEAYGLRPLV